MSCEDLLSNLLHIRETAPRDFTILRSGRDFDVLKNTWDMIQNDCARLFRETGYDCLNDLSSYPKIWLSLDPETCSCYKP